MFILKGPAAAQRHNKLGCATLVTPAKAVKHQLCAGQQTAAGSSAAVGVCGEERQRGQQAHREAGNGLNKPPFTRLDDCGVCHSFFLGKLTPEIWVLRVQNQVHDMPTLQ